MKTKTETVDQQEPSKPEYIVGDSILWIDGVAFQPGSPMTALDKIPEVQLQFFLNGGHLIRSEV